MDSEIRRPLLYAGAAGLVIVLLLVAFIGNRNTAPVGGGVPSGQGRATPTESPTGFDVNNPPAGAPAAQDVQLALGNAQKYWSAINTYGYGDKGLFDYVKRARPYMTQGLADTWTDLVGEYKANGGDDGYWKELLRTKQRHTVAVDSVDVSSFTADSLVFRVTFRAADVAAGAQVPAEATARSVDLSVERGGGKWLVSDAAEVVE